jgi:cellulose synthase/poly-beta-1,6-N-acetylglucosamine synthase-like glycosyltransferase
MVGMAVALVSTVVIVNGLLIFFWLLNYRAWNTATADAPRVAVLLAVRNEARYLPACLDHLLATNYPTDRWCVWVGNDQSEDATLAIAQQYAARDARVRVIDVTYQLGKARAKANVIAHLMQANAQAERPADVLLITDADVCVTPHWVRTMVRRWQAGSPARPVGIVTGVTVVAGKGAAAAWQRIDWLWALGMIKVASDLGIPVATLGNNMLLHRAAYQATGGYEGLPFSITEDFQILHRVVAHGYGFRNCIDADTLVMTQPMKSLAALLQQRKRWTRGAIQLPAYLVVILVLQALFLPLILVVAAEDWPLATSLWAAKAVSQCTFIILVIQKLRLPRLIRRQTLRYLIWFEAYVSVLSLVSLLYYLLPTGLQWKGRRF